MARYGQEFKNKAVARLLPPESASVSEVSRQLGVSQATLERWQSQALAEPTRERVWTAQARLDALLTTAMMDVESSNGWCRANGVYPQELARWREVARQSLAEPGESAGTRQCHQDRRRIQELEREVRRKDKALAETAALLVLSKKYEAIFSQGGDV